MNEETLIQNDMLVEASSMGVLLWRQHVGTFIPYQNWLRNKNNPAMTNIGVIGQNDIFMVCPVVITPEMVGKTIGVFVGVEVKTAKGKQREGQQNGR